jgi:hypothetical protein
MMNVLLFPSSYHRDQQEAAAGPAIASVSPNESRLTQKDECQVDKEKSGARNKMSKQSVARSSEKNGSDEEHCGNLPTVQCAVCQLGVP